MKLSVSYPVLPSDTEVALAEKEYTALVSLFNQLITNDFIKRSEGTDFINGGFVKKVNLTLTIGEESEIVEEPLVIEAELINEPISKGCTSCSN